MFGGLYEADASAAGQSVVLYVLLGMLTVNFLIEFISTVVLCPAISVPLLKLKERMENKKAVFGCHAGIMAGSDAAA